MVAKNDMVVILAVTFAVALPVMFLFIGLACMHFHDTCDCSGSQRGFHSDESEEETHVRDSGVTRSTTLSPQRVRTSHPTTQGARLGLTFERWVQPILTVSGENIGSNADLTRMGLDLDVGLDQFTIDSYPTSSFGERGPEESSDGSCVICLEKYCPEDVVRRLPCTHSFHAECIDPWLRIKAICPLCKERLFASIP